MIPATMVGLLTVRMEMVEAMELLKSVHLITVEWVVPLFQPKNRNIREFFRNWCFTFIVFIFCNFNLILLVSFLPLFFFFLNSHLRFDKISA